MEAPQINVHFLVASPTESNTKESNTITSFDIVVKGVNAQVGLMEANTYINNELGNISKYDTVKYLVEENLGMEIKSISIVSRIQNEESNKTLLGERKKGKEKVTEKEEPIVVTGLPVDMLKGDKLYGDRVATFDMVVIFQVYFEGIKMRSSCSPSTQESISEIVSCRLQEEISNYAMQISEDTKITFKIDLSHIQVLGLSEAFPQLLCNLHSLVQFADSIETDLFPFFGLARKKQRLLLRFLSEMTSEKKIEEPNFFVTSSNLRRHGKRPFQEDPSWKLISKLRYAIKFFGSAEIDRLCQRISSELNASINNKELLDYVKKRFVKGLVAEVEEIDKCLILMDIFEEPYRLVKVNYLDSLLIINKTIYFEMSTFSSIIYQGLLKTQVAFYLNGLKGKINSRIVSISPSSKIQSQSQSQSQKERERKKGKEPIRFLL